MKVAVNWTPRLALALSSLLLSSGCSAPFSFSPGDNTSPAAIPIVVGNPLVPSPKTSGLKILGAVCSTLSRCFGAAAASSCASGVQATNGIGAKLGLSPGTYDPYATLESAESAGQIVAQPASALSCIQAITDLSCGDPTVQGAYQSTSTTPFAGVPGMIPASCGDVFTNVSRVASVGGYDGGAPVSDSLISTGGAWASTGATLPGGSLENAQTVNFNGTIVLLGGDRGGPSSAVSAVFDSTDAIHWTTVGAFPGGNARTEGMALSFNGQLWYLGGSDASGTYQNVWTSADAGATWTDLGNNLPMKVMAAGATVFQNKMFIAGGMNGSATLSEVYSSVDGITWNLAGNLPQALNRGALLAYQGKLWWFGGHPSSGSSPASSQIWTSSDGATWTPVGTNTLPAGPDYAIAVTVFQGQLLFGAGYSGGAGSYTSSDGLTWSPVNPYLGAHFRSYTSFVVF